MLAVADFPTVALSAISNAFKDSLNDIYENGFSNDLHQSVFNAYYSNLAKSVGSFDNDKQVLIHNNLARFSAVKTASVLKNIASLRYDSKGLKRPMSDYINDANKTIKAYTRYQVAEYNTSVHRNRVIKQWNQFQGEKHLYPNIQWIRTRSANPRDLHLGYAGKVWAMNDPFWDNNQPGCMWNCKCSWKTTRAEATDNTEVKIVNPSPGLEGNPYYTNEIFTSKHPYHKEFADKPHFANLGSLYLPDEFAYVNYKTSKGDVFKVHHLAINEYDKVNKPFVQYAINEGYSDLKLLPQVAPVEKLLRKRYFDKYWDSDKCADAVNNDIFIEFKELKKIGKKVRRNIIDHIGDAAKKADVVFVKLPKKMNAIEFKDISDKMFITHKNLKKIIFINVDKAFSYSI